MNIDLTKLKRNYKLNPLKFGELPAKEDLVYLYIDLNLRISDLGKFFNRCKSACGNWLVNYGIKKDSRQANITRVETNLKKYGVESVAQLLEVQDRIKKTNLKKYGVPRPLQNEKVERKKEETVLKRYGNSCCLLNPDVKKKTLETTLNKYGVKNHSQKHYTEFSKCVLSSKETLINFILSQPSKTLTFLSNKLGIHPNTLSKYAHKFGIFDEIDTYTSSYELELRNIFSNISLIKTKAVIHPYEIDLYSPEHKIGIEFNGDYWHSTAIHKNKDYHLIKSTLARDKGVFLYHIFEYDWLNNKDIVIENLHKAFSHSFELSVDDQKDIVKQDISNQPDYMFINCGYKELYTTDPEVVHTINNNYSIYNCGFRFWGR